MLDEYPVIARNLTYKAGFRKMILNGISLVLKKNEFVGLLGGSGCGKTSLLTCLNGYRKASDGEVILNGVPIEDKKKIRHLIGYVPQDDIVHRTLSVEKALYYAFILRREDDVAEDTVKSEVDRVLELLDLKDHRNTKISGLSGGQRKRVSIGVELLHSPELFFLDEPTAGLDPSLERQMMRLLESLADENRLIVLTTHLMQNVDLFDVLILLHKGMLVYFGPGADIMKFFGVKDMIDLFDKVLSQSPGKLRKNYQRSSLNLNFLQRRLRMTENV